MLGNTTLPRGPLYDPGSTIQKFKFNEDIDTIRYNLLGTGGVYTDTKFMYYLGDEKEWKRPKEICGKPFFIKGKPNRFDAIQDELSDCWLVAAMNALTLNDSLIQHVVPDDQNFDHDYIGAFHFRVWKLGTWYDVVVDDRLPWSKKSKNLCYCHSRSGDVFWACLLEKAFAKVCGTDTVTYDSLELGTPMTAMQYFSGGLVEKVALNDPPPETTIKFYMSEMFSKNAMMVCMRHKDGNPNVGLISGHAYPVTGVFHCKDDDPDYHGLFLVRLLNPYGDREWLGQWSDKDYKNWRQIDLKIRQKLNLAKEKDGEFWMIEDDLVKFLHKLWICHLGPEQYLSSRNKSSHHTWETKFFHGEWVKNISAGGAGSTRYQNPQYKIATEWPKHDPTKDRGCQVVIEVTHWSKRGRYEAPLVGFFVYVLKGSNGSAPALPLKKEFFEKNEAINEKNAQKNHFGDSDGRAFLRTMKLGVPAEYVIVPCTWNQNDESQFLLRVFSESLIETYEYHTKVSKNLPVEENIVDGNDSKIKILYDIAAKGKDEISWIELRQILEKAMNPNKSYRYFIHDFFGFIRSIYAKIFAPSDDYDSGKIVFSKEGCRSMIVMLDDDHSGKLSYSEFRNLWKKICFWTEVYKSYKAETEECLSVSQLRDALSSIGYDVDIRSIHSLAYIYTNERGQISLTDFILCGVNLETTISLYQKHHIEHGGKIIFSLQDWVRNIL